MFVLHVLNFMFHVLNFKQRNSFCTTSILHLRNFFSHIINWLYGNLHRSTHSCQDHCQGLNLKCIHLYEELREGHMFLCLVELVGALSNCFLIKGVHNNMAPGLFMSFHWEQMDHH